MTDDRFRTIAHAAERHHGLTTMAKLRAAGISQFTLQRWVEAGRLVAARRGVFRVAGAPTTAHQRLLAAVWFHGDRAVASHRAAASLWGLPGFGSDIVEVSKPRGRSQRRETCWVHGSLVLPDHHITDRLAIPVTTPARTLFDLAGVVHPARAERALDAALSSRLVRLGEVQVVFTELARRGRRGTVTMRELLEVRGEDYVAPNSELEALGRAVFAAAGLPEPEVEVNLGDDDWIGRVDLLFREERLVVELDSARHHSALLDRRADIERTRRLRMAGWRVKRVSWWDLVERADEVVAEVHALLALAAA
jgi:predicted transcriptional regulator of viral defense system